MSEVSYNTVSNIIDNCFIQADSSLKLFEIIGSIIINPSDAFYFPPNRFILALIKPEFVIGKSIFDSKGKISDSLYDIFERINDCLSEKKTSCKINKFDIEEFVPMLVSDCIIKTMKNGNIVKSPGKIMSKLTTMAAFALPYTLINGYIDYKSVSCVVDGTHRALTLYVYNRCNGIKTNKDAIQESIKNYNVIVNYKIINMLS